MDAGETRNPAYYTGALWTTLYSLECTILIVWGPAFQAGQQSAHCFCLRERFCIRTNGCSGKFLPTLFQAALMSYCNMYLHHCDIIESDLIQETAKQTI